MPWHYACSAAHLRSCGGYSGIPRPHGHYFAQSHDGWFPVKQRFFFSRKSKRSLDASIFHYTADFLVRFWIYRAILKQVNNIIHVSGLSSAFQVFSLILNPSLANLNVRSYFNVCLWRHYRLLPSLLLCQLLCYKIVYSKKKWRKWRRNQRLECYVPSRQYFRSKV